MIDPNEFLMSAGAKAASFPTIGTTITGVVCGEPAVKQQTDPKDGSLKTFPSGDPMMVLTVPIQTDERAWPDDDGARTLWIGGKALPALRDAIRQAGAAGLEQGGVITQTYIADGERKPGLSPAKLYSFVYRPPVPGAAANAALMGTQQGSNGGAGQPASTPYVAPNTTATYSAPNTTTSTFFQAPLSSAPVATPNPYQQAATAGPPPGVDPGVWSALGVEQRAAILAATNVSA